jgi:DNA-binding GntR family transcriptional regulator
MAEHLPTLSNINAPPSLQDIAFQTMKQAIMCNELLAGKVYSEQAIAKSMGMSKTPVHQALQDLANKGFVSLLPRKGFKVKVLSTKNISDMFELRRALERTVILKITTILTAESIQNLEKIIDDIKQVRDPVEFQKHDRAFHRYLASLGGNTYIISALNNVWDLSDWIGASILRKRGGYNQAANEHLAVYEFLAVGDAKKAAAAMERHLNSTESRFLENIATNDLLSE